MLAGAVGAQLMGMGSPGGARPAVCQWWPVLMAYCRLLLPARVCSADSQGLIRGGILQRNVGAE